jgi:hypothetical protein
MVCQMLIVIIKNHLYQYDSKFCVTYMDKNLAELADKPKRLQAKSVRIVYIYSENA